MFDVAGIGANSIDFVYRLPDYPRPDGPSAKLRITSSLMSPGGQTATALCTCAAMGLRTTYVGTVGNDEGGRMVRAALAGRGVDTSAIVERDGPNPYAVILLDERQGERIVLWDRDPRLRLRPDDLRQEAIVSARVVHVDDVDAEAAMAAAQFARAAGIRVTSDIEGVNDFTTRLVAAVDIAIFAEPVPAALTGEADPERALRKLRAGHVGLLCVTLGARGAMLLDGDDLHHAPAPEVSAVDTTGAGDVFRGAFIYALLGGQPPDEILRIANTAAALACTRHGAIGGVPTLEELSLALTTKGTKNTKGAKETKRL